MVDIHFILACGALLSTSMAFYLLLTTMAIYAITRFGASDQIAGFSATAFILGAVGARVSTALIVQLCGRRWALVAASAASVIFAALTPVAGELWQLIAVRMLHGVCFGVVSTVVMSGILSRVPGHRRAEASGYLGITSTLSTAVGPFMAAWLIGHGGYEVLFAVAVGATVFGAVVAVPMKLPDGRQPKPREETTVEAATPGRSHAQHRNEQSLGGLAVVVLLVGCAYAGVAAYLAMYAAERDAQWSVGVYFALYAVVALVGRLTLGRIQDRYGDNVIVLPVMACFVLSLVMLWLADDGLMIALAGIPMGLGFGMFLPTMQAAAARVVTVERITVSVAVVYVAVDLGVGLAPFVLGPLAQVASLSVMYLVCAGVVIVAGAVYVLAHASKGRGGSRSLEVSDN